MKLVTNPIDRIATMLLGELSPTGVILSRIAFGFTMVASAMSFGFGKEMHWIHGLGLAFLTFITAICPDAVYHMYERGKWAIAFAVALVAMPMFVMEFSSHAGYAAGFRGVDMASARVSQVKWQGAQDATVDHKKNMDLWIKQLETLQAEKAALVSQNAWAPTVKADGLRSELAMLNERIEQEKAGNRGRRAGCGRECERLQNEARDVGLKIGTVEKLFDLDFQIAAKNKQIEATQKILDGSRDVAAKTEHRVSPISFQNKFFARVAALTTSGSLNVTETLEEGSEQSLAIGLAYVFTMGPAIAWLLAGMYRLSPRGAMQFASNIGHAASAAASHAAHKFGEAAAGVTHVTNVKVDDMFGKYMAARLAEREALRAMGKAANA